MIIEITNPTSVVDFGCGIGIWLAAFQERGVTDIHGVDGDWVKLDSLVIPRERFTHADLANARQATARLGRRFDLALSLEVAEHLPPESADQFVAALVSMSDVVCFSGAIPKQRGFQHVNEQWQSYWAKKFNAHGYMAFDLIRPRLLAHRDILPFYRQNIVLYANAVATEGRLKTALAQPVRPSQPDALDYVIPEYYLIRIGPKNLTVGAVFAELPRMVWRSLQTKWRRLTTKARRLRAPIVRS
jgi:hypothetical protein